MDYFTADTHFSGRNIIKRENRPYKNIIEMDEDIIAKFNTVMCEHDTLWHLGDFFNYNNGDLGSWMSGACAVRELNCRVILIIGNNEERVIRDIFDNKFGYFKSWCCELGFYDVQRFAYIEISGMQIHLNHYPVRRDMSVASLFGHVHRNVLCCREGLNVGCDLNHFYPYSIAEVVNLLSDKEKHVSKNLDVLSMCESYMKFI